MFSPLFLTLYRLVSITIALQEPLTGSIHDLRTCHRLSLSLHKLVTFSDSLNYAEQSGSYWALNQGQLHPTCYVSPRTNFDLQAVLRILHESPSPLSIRSGGHSSVASTSNIADGVTIDLSSLSSISIGADQRTITIGTGARWSDVYDTISQYPGLAVSGARDSTVGIGGYLLGGGLSPFSSLSGWACDNIVSMDVFLPNATLVTASPSSHSSLFTALKGASSNFGIVTSFTLSLTKLPNDQSTFEVVILSYDIGGLQDVLNLLADITANASSDPYVSVSVSLTTWAHDDTPLLTVAIQSLLQNRTPSVIRPFLDLNYTDVLYEAMTQSTFCKLVSGSNLPGHCEHKTTFTSTKDAAYAASIASSYVSLFNSTSYSPTPKEDDSAFRAALLIQPLTLPHLSHSYKTANPNILGLSSELAPLLVYSFEIRHKYSDYLDSDEHYPSLLREFVQSHASDSSAHPFRYINYASAEQDVFGASKRDEKEWAWLKGVRREYDPDEWWERWNGGELGPFKIR